MTDILDKLNAWLAQQSKDEGRTFHAMHPEVLIAEAKAEIERCHARLAYWGEPGVEGPSSDLNADEIASLVAELETLASELEWGQPFAASVVRKTASALSRVAEERDQARRIVRDIHWMAVRYADGRQSYAPGMCNDALRKAYDAGWLTYQDFTQHDLDPQYAREGDKPEYRSIEARATTAEAELSRVREALRVAEAVLRHAEPFSTTDNGRIPDTTPGMAAAAARLALSPVKDVQATEGGGK